MRLSKTTNYAIRILIDCAQAEGALVKVAEISERREITPQNTFKIVHLLSRAGFVRAVRGRHGGVRRARARASAGNSIAARMPMMAMTTSSSIRVNPLRFIFFSPLAFVGVGKSCLWE